jgi:hypothetical protein
MIRKGMMLLAEVWTLACVTGALLEENTKGIVLGLGLKMNAWFD